MGELADARRRVGNVETAVKRQAPLIVGANWREFAPLNLLPTLEGAMEVFPAKGFNGATVRDLASAAGVTMPTLYYHHGDKQNMLMDLLVLGFNELLARTARARAATPSDPLSQFDCFVEVAVLHMTERVQLAVLESEIRYLEADNRERYLAMRKSFEDQLLHIMAEARDAGVFSPDHPREVARALLGMIQAITIWYRRDGGLTPGEIAQRYRVIARRVVSAPALV